VLEKLRSHLTYANVMVTLLAFVVLGGGAYAASRLPDNSVRSRNIVDGQVLRRDLGAGSVNNGKLAPDAVTGAKVADGTLTGGDVRADSLTGLNIDESSLGQVPNATQAGNAQTLGGNPPSQFVVVCQQGAVKGYGRIHGAAANFPATFTSSSTYIDNAFSCTGTWNVSRPGIGRYRIIQNGGNTALEPTGVVATVDSASGSGSGEDDFVSATRINSNEWELIVRDADGGREDATLTFMAF
jgi:hypothetical protein